MPIWSQEAFVSGLGLSLLHSLWQGALLGLVGLLLHRRMKGSTPETRCGAFSVLQCTFFAAWLGTFLTLYMQGIHPAASVLPAAVAESILTGAQVSPIAAQQGADLMHLLHSLTPFLVTAWALGVCLLSLRHLGGLLFLHRLCNRDAVPCLPAWEACANRLAAQMGIGRAIVLRCSAQIDVPFAFGLFKSTILLPVSAMLGLTPEQAEALIAHELAHIARHDVFFNLVQVCMETILFYHPVVWWLSTQIRVAREQSCDDLAVQIIGDRALYARALYTLEEARASTPHLALGAKGDRSKMANKQLIQRIQRVLGVSTPEKRDPWTKGALALCAATIGLATLIPVQAYSRPAPQDPPAKKQTKVVKVNTKVMVNIKGDKIELSTTELKPDTRLKVNGKEGRFADLTPKQQQELRDVLKALPARGAMHKVTVKMLSGTDLKTIDGTNVKVFKTGAMKVLLNINGDKIELTGTELKPETRVTVNGKEGRFGDLTPKQQEQLSTAVSKIQVIHSDETSDIEEALQGLDLPDGVKKHIIIKIQDQTTDPAPTGKQ
jgi:beta-lactamase regulating signal transducer with metallopeptidase domain